MLVLEARARLGGRATAFPDRETGELVDNGQHVLLGCYTRDVRVPARHRRRAITSGSQPQLAVTMIDRARAAVAARMPGAAAAVASARRRPRLGRAVVARSPVGAADGGAAAAARAGRCSPARRVKAASPGETVENWLIRNGQTPRLREMLWDPLALAALNQPPRAGGGAGVRARAGRDVRPRSARGGDRACRPSRCTRCTPSRRARYIESRGGTVRTGAPATVRVDGRRASQRVEAAASAGRRTRVIAAVPWFALAELFERRPPAPLARLLDRARAGWRRRRS